MGSVPKPERDINFLQQHPGNRGGEHGRLTSPLQAWGKLSEKDPGVSEPASSWYRAKGLSGWNWVVVTVGGKWGGTQGGVCR